MTGEADHRRCGSPAMRPRQEGQPMRVTVDRAACEANGVCAGLVPEVFALDDDDNLRILTADVPPGLAGAVRHAVQSCPKAALSTDE
jgi:ferredoxin